MFREVWRVLRDDGTVWLNLGDSFANDGGSGRQGTRGQRFDRRHTAEMASQKPLSGLKPKDLMLMPTHVATALRGDGWYLRQTIVWDKANPMPESVEDRPTASHEYIFLLAKSGRPLCWRHRDLGWAMGSGVGAGKRPAPDLVWRHKTRRDPATGERVETAEAPKGADAENWTCVNLWRGFDYYYDARAIMEPSSPDSHARAARGRSDTHKNADGGPGHQTIAIKSPVAGRFLGGGVNPKAAQAPMTGPRPRQNASYSAALGSAELVAMRNKRTVWRVGSEPFEGAHFATFPPDLIEPCILAGCPPGGTVLDPFGGAGTVGLVADRHQRNAVLVELSPAYAEMARARIAGDAALLSQVRVVAA